MNIVQTSQFHRLLVHSLPVKDTPTLDKEGTQREADDFHPRARLRALHKQKAIIVNDAASIEAFSNIYIIEESLVKDYLAHLKHIEMMSGKWKQEKQTKKPTGRQNTVWRLWLVQDAWRWGIEKTACSYTE